MFVPIGIIALLESQTAKSNEKLVHPPTKVDEIVRERTENVDKFEQQLESAREYVQLVWPQFLATVQSHGWDLSHLLLPNVVRLSSMYGEERVVRLDSGQDGEDNDQEAANEDDDDDDEDDNDEDEGRAGGTMEDQLVREFNELEDEFGLSLTKATSTKQPAASAFDDADQEEEEDGGTNQAEERKKKK